MGIEVELAIMPYLQEKGIPDMFIQAAESQLLTPSPISATAGSSTTLKRARHR